MINWITCAVCKSYRFGWIARHRIGFCRDCGHTTYPNKNVSHD